MRRASIFNEIKFDANKPIIEVLFETQFTKEIRIAMQKGTVMKEHKTSYPIVVQVVEGSIDFRIVQQTTHLTKGDLIALEGDIPHHLKANEDSILRLTLTKYDNAERVKDLIQ